MNGWMFVSHPPLATKIWNVGCAWLVGVIGLAERGQSSRLIWSKHGKKAWTVMNWWWLINGIEYDVCLVALIQYSVYIADIK